MSPFSVRNDHAPFIGIYATATLFIGDTLDRAVYRSKFFISKSSHTNTPQRRRDASFEEVFYSDHKDAATWKVLAAN